MKKHLAFLFITAAISNTAHAVEDIHQGFFWGAGFGHTSYVDDTWDESSYSDTQDSTRKIYAGYRFNRIVAVELGYTDYGQVKSCHNSSCSLGSYTVEPEAFSIAANVGYTFDNGLRPFAIVGLSSIDLNQSERIFDSDSDVSFRFGIGGEFSPKEVPELAFRLSWEMDLFDAEEDRYDDDDWWDDDDELFSSVSSIYLGISYQF